MAQTLIPGVSVSQVARRYDVNTNLVFTWRRDPRLWPAVLQEPEARRRPTLATPFAAAADQPLYLSSTYWSPTMLAIRLPTDIEERLDRLAKATGRTKTFYAREAILEHLDELEDLYLAEQRLIENRAGRSRTYTLEEVERELGLAD